MGEAIPSGARGWVFFCNDQTQTENLRRNVVGTLEKYLPRFHDLQPGIRLTTSRRPVRDSA